jgi:outer membrane protein OmpA-like peptidoglycan-associated protein
VKKILTLILLSFCFGTFAQEPCKKFTVEVCIPGAALLHIKHGNMHWELLSDMPPGAYELCIGETKINGSVWEDWKMKYNLGFNTDNCKLNPVVVRKHDISVLLQSPSAKNGWETIWHFNDPSGSAHYYSTSFEFCTTVKDKTVAPVKKEEKPKEEVIVKTESKKDTVIPKEIKVVELPFYTIYFDKQKATITAASQVELNSICNVLKTNTTVVEIFGYEKTDGHDANDLKLYNERALVLCGYLMGKGLDQKRIQYVGYGDKAVENTKVKRIELKILE